MGAKGAPKTGGRKKGVLNKTTKDLLERAEALDIDPFEILLLFAKGDWKALGYPSATEIRFNKSGECYEIDRITSDHRLKAASETAQYLYPKRKSVDYKDDETPEDPLEDLSDEELDKL